MNEKNADKQYSICYNVSSKSIWTDYHYKGDNPLGGAGYTILDIYDTEEEAQEECAKVKKNWGW